MNEFEKTIERTFQRYRNERKASLVFLHPPMRVAGMMGRVPCYVQAGKAPFDVGGMYYDRHGTVIGVELKQNAEHETALPIVGPMKKGNGLQYHQLSALVDVHDGGGVALILWNNGGEVGMLRGGDITYAKTIYDASLKAEQQKKTPAKGSRSIPWEDFEVIEKYNDDLPLWLPPSPAQRKKVA